MLKIDYFNPVVDDWTEECYQEELRQRESCDICLYVITPEMMGVYSIAEVVDDSNKRPDKTVFCLLEEANSLVFGESEMKSLKRVGEMIDGNGATYVRDLHWLARVLNEWS